MKYVEIENNVYVGVNLQVKDCDGNELEFTTNTIYDEITVYVNMKSVNLSQFTGELLARHPEMRPEIEQILNEIELKNNLVKP